MRIAVQRHVESTISTFRPDTPPSAYLDRLTSIDTRSDHEPVGETPLVVVPADDLCLGAITLVRPES